MLEPAHRAPIIGFSLRFEAGRGVATLARPVASAVSTLTRLVMDFGRLQPPIDLRAGANRFKHRRARVIELEARLDLDALARVLSRNDLEMRVLGTSPEKLSLVLRDPVRTIALDLLPAWEGCELVLAVRNVRAALEGPRSAIADALDSLHGYGAEMDPDLGVLRLGDPLLELLTEALVPHGWRVPELASIARRAPLLEGRHLVLRTGTSNVIADETRAALEDARVLAPLLTTLVSKDGKDALHVATELSAKTQRKLLPLEAISADIALAVGQPPTTIPPDVSLCLRAAVQRDAPEAIAEYACELGSTEPCDEIAIEGLRASSSLLRELDPSVAADLSARAFGRKPRDGTLALEWLERASRAPTSEPLIHALRSLQKTFVGPMRGSVLRGAAALLDRAGDKGAALAAWEEACQLAPNDAVACEGLARALGASDRHDEALAAWDRAARLHSDPDHAARALMSAASEARATSHMMGAASRLESAVARVRSDELHAEAWRELARIRCEMGVAELEREVKEPSNVDPRKRAQAARAIAERLRASGHLGDAALALAQAGVFLEDSATLRAALELAEKAEAWKEALFIIDRAIELVGDGPARGALEARRDAIRMRDLGTRESMS